MARYDTNHPDARRIQVFDSEGKLVPRCKAVDTDEGWADVYKLDPEKPGKVMLTAWEPDPDKPGHQRRHPVVERVLGKFEIRYK